MKQRSLSRRYIRSVGESLRGLPRSVGVSLRGLPWSIRDRRHYRPFGLISLLVLVLLALPANQPATTAQTEQVYLALGDSIPAGLLSSLPAERGYPALLHELLETDRSASGIPGGVDLINLAEPGETVQSFLDDGQLDRAIETIEDIPAGSLRTVTITLGGNNMLALWEMTASERESELQSFQSDFGQAMGELADALEPHDADTIVTTYYDLTGGDPDAEGSNAWWLRQFNEVIVNAAADAGFQVVDLEEVFRNRIDELTWFPADVHPTNAGHEVISRTIWQTLGYDQAPPDVSITRPETGEARSQVPTIHATVDDAFEIESVILQADGEDQHELIFVPEYGAWIGLWDGRSHPGSETELTVVATDISGNEASASVTISVPVR